MSKSSSDAGQVPSTDNQGGVEMISRRKMDARKMFEESLQKVKRTSLVDTESSELMNLLLTTRPLRSADGSEVYTSAAAPAPFDVVKDVDFDAKKSVVSSVACSTTSKDEDKVFDARATAGDDGTSVFTSDKLDEYLANDRMPDTSVAGVDSVVDAPSIKDLDVNWNSSTVTKTGKPQESAAVSVSWSSVKDKPIQCVDSSCMTASEGSCGRASEVEVDFIDGFSFYSFSTPDALLQHVDDSSQSWRTGMDAGGSRTKKFQYGIAGNMTKYLAKMKGWEKRSSMACDQRADALVTLLSDGMVRQLSDGSAVGLNLNSAGDTMISAIDGERAGVGRYLRRGVGKMGDEERQPRKGRIYGRKFDGRFASKANIHYHIKRRGSPTSPYAAVLTKTESSSSLSSSSGHSGISGNSSQLVTTERNISRLLSPSLQPRVDLTKAIIPPLKTSLTKDDDRLSSRTKVACSKNKTVTKSWDQIHLIRLTEPAARRAIVALQLAPSMTNSPMKCNKPSCSHSGINSCRYSTTSDPPAPYDSGSPGLSLPPTLPGVLCTEDFCRLGCVCDSIKRSMSPAEARQRDHCGHADCMLECTCTYRTRLRSGRMSLYDRETAPGDDDPFPPDIHAIQPSVVRPQPYQSAAPKPPPKLRRLHRELTRLHVRSEEKALVGDYSADDGGLVRKSGRIREREQLSFSGFEKMKPLFLYDASFMLNDDVNRGRRRKAGGKEDSRLMLRDFTKLHHGGNPLDSCHSYEPLEKPYVRIEVDDDVAYGMHQFPRNDDGDKDMVDEFLLQDSCARTVVYAAKQARLKHLENLPVGGRNDTAGTCHSLSQQRKMPNVIASEKMHLRESSSPAITVNKMNRMPLSPDRQLSSQGLDHSTLSKEATRVDWKMKPELSNNKSLTESGMSGPMIAAVEGGFHTQYLLFTRNDAASATAAAKSAFLLKVQSNCCWDSIRLRILEIISKQCRDNTVYPPIKQLHIGGFLVEILPKAARPEVLPPDVQKRMMSQSLHAICIRITVDRSLASSALCTSLATGMSAFTKLKVKFPSEKSHKNIKSSQSSVLHEASVVPSLTASCHFGPFSNRPVNTTTETVMQLSIATVPGGGNPETSQTAMPTNSVCSKPAILCSSSSSSSADSSTPSTKLNSNTSHVGDSKLPPSNKTECTGEPGTLIMSPVSELPASAVSNMQSVTSHVCENKSLTELHSSTSVVSSSTATYSSGSENSLMLPIRGHKSVKLNEDVLGSCAKDAVDGSLTLKTVTGSLSSITENCEASVELPDEVIIVEEDDSLPPETCHCQLSTTDADAAISSILCSSAGLSSVQSQISFSQSASSDAVQIISEHNNNISLVQSPPDITTLSRAAGHSISLADASGNGLSAVPITSDSTLSLNIASSQLSSAEQSVLTVTTASQTISSSPKAISPGYECTAAEVEQVIIGQHSEEVKCIVNTTKPILSGLLLTIEDSSAPTMVNTKAAAPNTSQPVVNKAHVDSLVCDKELSKDAENYSMKHGDTNQRNHDLECLPIALTSAEEVVNGATSGESEASFLPVKLVQSAEQSSAAVNEHQQPCPAEVPGVSALPANIVEIVPSDEDHLSLNSDVDITSFDQSSSVFDDDACDVDVIATSTPDNSSADDTHHSAEGEQVRRISRNKRRKQLLTERPTAAEFPEKLAVLPQERVKVRQSPSPNPNDDMLNMHTVRERDRRSAMQRQFHYLHRMLQLTGFTRGSGGVLPKKSKQFTLNRAVEAVISLTNTHKELSTSHCRLQRRHDVLQSRLRDMGLETPGIISDTNRLDLPASVEAREDSSVLPKLVTIPRKRKYRSASSVLHSSTSVTTSVADVASVTTDAEVASSQQATAAAVDVVASMHSYAMPGYIRRPTKFSARLTTARSSSGDNNSKTSNNSSNTADAEKPLLDSDKCGKDNNDNCSSDGSSPGGSKSVTTSASKKAEEAVKSGRLVVTGQLLQMLSNSQRPRSAACSAGIDKSKQGPLSWKFRDISVKDWTGSDKSKRKKQPTANTTKLKMETGDGILDRTVESMQTECASEDLVTADASDILTVNVTSADTFCPKITNIVSLEDIQ